MLTLVFSHNVNQYILSLFLVNISNADEFLDSNGQDIALSKVEILELKIQLMQK